MGDFVQSVILSDLLVFTIMAAAGFWITAYAFQQREYAGYALGWLGGLFLIIVLSAGLPYTTPDSTLDYGGSGGAQISFLATFVPGVLGLMAGFGGIAVLRISQVHSYRIGRALGVAALMCLVLVAGYLMILSPYMARLAIAVFVLGIGISVLFNSILSRYRRSGLAEPVEGLDPEDEIPAATMGIPASTVMNRVEKIRQRFRENRPTNDVAEYR